MQVRGRGDRMSFAESFKDVYNFRLLYGSSVAFFPIKASLARAGGSFERWILFYRLLLFWGGYLRSKIVLGALGFLQAVGVSIPLFECR